jgi:predicted dehydrogenase
MKKRVAVVGLGVGRRHIAEGYSQYPDKFEVVGLCDLNTELMDRVGDEFGIARRTTRYEEALSMPEVDIVDICTPPAIHLAQIVAAFEAGKDIICEKPLVGSLADMDTVIAAEQASKSRLMPIFQYRFGNGFARAKHLVDSGIAGRAYTATVETAWRRSAEYYAVPWRGRYATELGGTLLNHAIHSHDLMTHMLGPVASVFCRTATRVHAIEVEDCASASLRMESGALVNLSATVGSQDSISRLRFHFENLTFESCLKPHAPGDDPWQIIAKDADVQQRVDEALKDWTFVPSRFAGQLLSFHAAITQGREFPVTTTDARRALELVTALYYSAQTGADVSLPLGADHPKYRDWTPMRMA